MEIININNMNNTLNSYEFDNIHNFANYESQITIKRPNTLRIMTYNVHGFKNLKFKNTLANIINNISIIDPDIIMLEEVYINKKNVLITKNELITLMENIKLKYYVFSNSEINAVFSKFPFKSEEIYLGRDPIKKIARNAIKCSFNIESHNNIIFIGTHLDVFDETGETRKKQIKIILNDINNDDNININNNGIIICGDFNSLRQKDYTVTEWDELVYIDKDRNVNTVMDVIPIIENDDFIDSFEYLKKRIKISVWSNRRVDYIYGKNIKFESSDSYKNTSSDHYPIYADILLN